MNKLNEGIFSHNVEDLYNKIKKDKEVDYYKSIEIMEDINGVQLHYELNGDSSTFRSSDNNEIIKQLRRFLNMKIQPLNKYRDYFSKGLRGFASTFSKDYPYVTITGNASMDKVVSTERNDYAKGTIRANYDRKVFRFSESHVDDLHISEDEYIEKYGEERLNKIDIYVLLTIEGVEKNNENINNKILKFNDFKKK